MEIQTPWLKGRDTGIVQVLNTEANEWVSLIDPSSMKMSTYDLDSGEGTGRNQNGEMFRDRVAIKEKLEMTFPPMLRADYGTLLNLVRNDFFQCRYYSDLQGTVRTVTMYVGDRSMNIYFGYKTSDQANAIVKDISFNFIEK